MSLNNKNTLKKLIFDADKLDGMIDVLIKKYPFISVVSIGQSTLGRAIPMINIGKGRKRVLLIGGMAADESEVSALLMRFLRDYCESIQAKAKVYGYNMAYLEYTRSISIIPMLNADGIEYLHHGVDKENPVFQYLSRTCKVDDSGKDWLGNARGIDLKTNFPSTFEDSYTKELEAESGALRNYLMFDHEIRLLLTLTRGTPQVLYTYGDRRLPRLDPIGNALADMCAASYEKSDIEGTLCGFCTEELMLPSFDIRSKFYGDGFEDYARLRKLLFISQSII